MTNPFMPPIKVTRRILGLDPATVTGFAHSNGEHGIWDLNNGPRHEGGRFAWLRSRILEVHATWGIDLIAFEESSLGAGGTREGGPQWSTIVFHNKVRGVVEEVACSLQVDLLPVNPATLKAFATGSGRAKKPDMIRALERHFGIRVVDDNEADAIWVLKYAQQYQSRPVEMMRPKAKRKAARKAIQKSRKLF